MSEGTFATCATHGESMASFRCESCQRYLCYDCVEEGKYLNRCRSCGEQAHLLEDTWQPDPDELSPLDMPAKDILYRERSAGPPQVKMSDDPLTHVFNHVVVPGATIAMVASVLFFLLDVRSVFFSGSANLKWLGFWFVFATVLIARFGKSQGNKERVGCYSLGLTVATILAINLGPWQEQGPGWQGPLFNSLILLAVWRFATAVTSGLDFEGEERDRRGQRLFGLERLTVEAMQRHRKASGKQRKKTSAEVARALSRDVRLPASRSPNRAVARLAAGVMVLFALGEPALLKGPPEVAGRGFSAMVVFLLATAVVLGGAAVLDVFRRVRDAGGKASATLLPRRVLAAGVTMVMLLSIAVAIPGVHLQGRDQTYSEGAKADAESRGAESRADGAGAGESGAGEEGSESSSGETGAEQTQQTLETSAGDPQRSNSQPPPSSSEGNSSPLRGGSMLINILTQLGTWLRYPALLAALIFVVVALRRLLPLLGGWKGLANLWQGFLGRWANLLRRRPQGGGPSRRSIDPWRGVEGLVSLPAPQAVRQAYGHVLLLLEDLGYARAEDRTPHEVLASLPRRYRMLQPALEGLTDLYVATEYGIDETSEADRRLALQHLGQLRQLSEPLLAVR